MTGFENPFLTISTKIITIATALVMGITFSAFAAEKGKETKDANKVTTESEVKMQFASRAVSLSGNDITLELDEPGDGVCQELAQYPCRIESEEELPLVIDVEELINHPDAIITDWQNFIILQFTL